MIYIRTIQPVCEEYIDAVINGEEVDLRRSGPESWERRYGDTWQGIWEDSELEKAYQNYMAR